MTVRNWRFENFWEILITYIYIRHTKLPTGNNKWACKNKLPRFYSESTPIKIVVCITYRCKTLHPNIYFLLGRQLFDFSVTHFSSRGISQLMCIRQKHFTHWPCSVMFSMPRLRYILCIFRFFISRVSISPRISASSLLLFFSIHTYRFVFFFLFIHLISGLSFFFIFFLPRFWLAFLSLPYENSGKILSHRRVLINKNEWDRIFFTF